MFLEFFFRQNYGGLALRLKLLLFLSLYDLTKKKRGLLCHFVL